MPRTWFLSSDNSLIYRYYIQRKEFQNAYVKLLKSKSELYIVKYQVKHVQNLYDMIWWLQFLTLI